MIRSALLFVTVLLIIVIALLPVILWALRRLGEYE